jgi:phosphatidate cytidylyltransferase
MFNCTIWPETIALIVGKNFGKRNFSYFISPNKTIEGLIGQFAAIPFCMFILWLHMIFVPNAFPMLSMWYYLFFTISITFSCVIGDLMESVFKRATLTKNSPVSFLGDGLGGFLDKYDSMGFVVLGMLTLSVLVNFENYLLPNGAISIK